MIENNESMVKINQSMIENNESIIEVNQSIIENNESMIESIIDINLLMIDINQ